MHLESGAACTGDCRESARADCGNQTAAELGATGSHRAQSRSLRGGSGLSSEGKCAEGLDPDLFVALDPGVNILAALTSNKPGFVPRLVSGSSVKAVNQLYNKQREHRQKQLAKGKNPNSPPAT